MILKVCFDRKSLFIKAIKNFQQFLQGWDCVTQTLISSWYRKVKIPSQKLKKSFPTEKLPSQKLRWGSFRSSVLDWFDLAATEPDHRHASLKQISFLFICKINIWAFLLWTSTVTLSFNKIRCNDDDGCKANINNWRKHF